MLVQNIEQCQVSEEPIAVNDDNLWQRKYKECYQLPITRYPRSIPHYRQSLLI